MPWAPTAFPSSSVGSSFRIPPVRSRYRVYWPKLPKLFQRILPSPRPVLDTQMAVRLLNFAGPAPLSLLLPELKSPVATAREVAAEGIFFVLTSGQTASPRPDVLVPALIPALGDSAKAVRLFSAGALGEIGPAASPAVPALIVALGDDDLTPVPGSTAPVRAWSARALGKVGPAARPAVPTLKRLMAGSDQSLRWVSAIAIWRIDGDVDDTLPVLITELPKTIENSKRELILALGEMGPRATNAVQVLENEFAHASIYNRQIISNALVKIDPDTAANLRAK